MPYREEREGKEEERDVRDTKIRRTGRVKGRAALLSPAMIFEGFSGLKPHKSVRLAGSNRAENTVGIEERGVETSRSCARDDCGGRGAEERESRRRRAR